MANVSLKDSHEDGRARYRPARRLLALLSLPRWSVFLAIGIAVVVLAGVIVDRTIERMGDRIASAGYSVDPAPLQVGLAGIALAVPANMIRFAEQRRPGLSDRLDLFVRWPELRGFSERMADEFAGSAVSIIFLSLSPPGSVGDPIHRLETVYRYLFTGASWLGPDGLVGRRLADESAYAREALYYEPGSVDPFIARCLDGTQTDILPMCLVEVNVGGLSAVYRFNQTLLPEWRAIDARLRDLVAGFRR
jgi:hypothetical protein